MTKTKSNRNPETDADQNPDVQLPAVVIPTGDQYIEQAVNELQTVDPQQRIDEAIARLRDQYSGITVSGLDDRPAYITAKDGAKVVKDLRLAVENKRKDLKEFPLRYGRAVDAEAKRITEQLTPLEAHLKAQVEAYENAEKVAAQKEALRRHTLLTEAGWKFTGTFYICGPHSLTADHINKMDEKALAKAEQFSKDEQKREAAAEQARLSAIKQQQEEADRLAKEQAELRAEAERVKQERYETRCEWLMAKGFELSQDGTTYQHGTHPAVWVQVGTIRDAATKDWQDTAKTLLDSVAFEAEAAKQQPDMPKTTLPEPFAHPPVDHTEAAPFDADVDPFGQMAIEAATELRHSPEYVEGFNACRADVLALLADTTPRKKADYVSLINSMQP